MGNSKGKGKTICEKYDIDHAALTVVILDAYSVFIQARNDLMHLSTHVANLTNS